MGRVAACKDNGAALLFVPFFILVGNFCHPGAFERRIRHLVPDQSGRPPSFDSVLSATHVLREVLLVKKVVVGHDVGQLRLDTEVVKHRVLSFALLSI